MTWGWTSSKHPRYPKGSPLGGKFRPSVGGLRSGPGAMLAYPVPAAPRRPFQSLVARQQKALAAFVSTPRKEFLASPWDPSKSLVSRKMEARGRATALIAYRIPKPDVRHRAAADVKRWRHSTSREDKASLRGYRRGIVHRPPRKNWAHSPAELRLMSHPRIAAPYVRPTGGGGVWNRPTPHPKGVGALHRGKTPARLPAGAAGR